MEEINPGIITVEVIEHQEMYADHADIIVTVKGSSLVAGNTALKKAQEVAQLVSGLMRIGVNESDIHLRNVQIEKTSSPFNKSSSAQYLLQIHCPNLEQLEDILTVISEQKNVVMGGVVWGYPDFEETKMEWTERCIRAANEKARRIAIALNVQLLGIRQYREDFPFDGDAPRSKIREDALYCSVEYREIDLGFTLSHTKVVSLRISIDYRVSDFNSGT